MSRAAFVQALGPLLVLDLPEFTDDVVTLAQFCSLVRGPLRPVFSDPGKVYIQLL